MSLEDIPQGFADYFVINLATAQVILSIAMIFTVILPVMYLTKGKALTMYLVMFVLVESLLVGIGWMPFWILIATIAVIALGLAKIGAEGVAGD